MNDERKERVFDDGDVFVLWDISCLMRSVRLAPQGRAVDLFCSFVRYLVGWFVMDRVALYARVSDDKKKDDGSRRQDVERQLELLRKHCKLAGFKKWKEYVDDGKSAFTEDLNQRPAFKQLLNDIRRHFVKRVFIEDLTRYSRRLDLGLQWLKEMGLYDATVTSIREGEIEITSSQGWMRSSILLMFAEWDSRIKSEKVKSGMQKARNLRKHVGRPRKKKGGSES